MKNNFLNRNFILTVSLSAVVYIASNMLITTLPKHAVALGQSKLVVGILMLIYTLCACFTRLIWGRIADKKGRMVVVYIGIILNIIAVVMLFFKSDIFILFISRGVFGAGFSAVVTACATLSTEVVPHKDMSKAIAIYGLGGVLTQAIAPPFALHIYKYGLVAVAVAVITLLLVSAALAKGIETLNVNNKKNEFKEKSNDKYKNLILKKSIVLPSIIAGIITFSTAGVFSFVPLLTEERNLQTVSGFFVANSLGLLFSRLIFVKIDKKISHDKMFYLGIMLFFTGFLMLSFTNKHISLIGAGALYGYGLGTVHPILNTKAVSDTTAQNRAEAMAIFYAFQDMGVAIGSIVCGLLADIFTLKAVFLTCAAVAIFSVVPYFFVRKQP